MPVGAAPGDADYRAETMSQPGQGNCPDTDHRAGVPCPGHVLEKGPSLSGCVEGSSDVRGEKDQRKEGAKPGRCVE
jgi:hypothetical protein